MKATNNCVCVPLNIVFDNNMFYLKGHIVFLKQLLKYIHCIHFTLPNNINGIVHVSLNCSRRISVCKYKNTNQKPSLTVKLKVVNLNEGWIPNSNGLLAQ